MLTHSQILSRDLYLVLTALRADLAYREDIHLSSLRFDWWEGAFRWTITRKRGSYEDVMFIEAPTMAQAIDEFFVGYLDTKSPYYKFYPSKFVRKRPFILSEDNSKGVK